MSKVILQRGTKERRGLKEKTAIKFQRFSITLARGGPASSQSLAAGERACSIESHIANPTHTKKGKKIIKYLFSLSHQRATPPSPSPQPHPTHFISYRIISQLLISQRWGCFSFLHSCKDEIKFFSCASVCAFVCMCVRARACCTCVQTQAAEGYMSKTGCG